MRVAYLPDCAVADPRNQYERASIIAEELRRAGADLYILDPEIRRALFIHRVGHRLARRLGRQFRPERSRQELARQTRRTEAWLSEVRPDVVVSLSTLHVAYLRTAVPCVCWVDAVFDCLVDYYPEFRRLDSLSLRWGHRAERAALARSNMTFVTSQWALDVARRAYGHDVRVSMLPWGANLREIPTRDAIEGSWPLRRERREFTFVICGTDWHRKGGDIAFEAVGGLVSRGVPARLVVVGMTPPPGLKLPGWLEIYPRLRKDDASQRETWNGLFSRAHAMLLPTRADCTPHVVCEAAAYGLPTIATRTGGMASLIDDTRTGRLVAEPTAEAFGEAARALAIDTAATEKMGRQAYEHFRRELAYDINVARMLSFLASDRQAN